MAHVVRECLVDIHVAGLVDTEGSCCNRMLSGHVDGIVNKRETHTHTH